MIRQQILENVGFRVIRFKDEEVLKEINRVREVIQITIEELKKINPPPSPSKGG